jgi:beta-phosphoglucomutase
VAGLLELVARARSWNSKLALVTNAPAENMHHELEVLGLRDAFDVRVLAGELPAGKPDPLPYLRALELLGVQASEGFAFEDSVSGIRSAVGAGLRVAGITTTQPGSVLAEAGADPIIADFADPELLRLLEL